MVALWGSSSLDQNFLDCISLIPDIPAKSLVLYSSYSSYSSLKFGGRTFRPPETLFRPMFLIENIVFGEDYLVDEGIFRIDFLI